MSLIFIFAGLLAMLVGIGGYFIPQIRDVETILPDHDSLPEASDQVPALAV